MPEAARGKIEGASMQGIGQALFEHLVLHGARLLTSAPQQCRVPLMSDLPADFKSIALEQGRTRGPLGAKGVGGAGILGVDSAISNVLEDAWGLESPRFPLSPSKVLAGPQARLDTGYLSADQLLRSA